jgi:hypothetical protein
MLNDGVQAGVMSWLSVDATHARLTEAYSPGNGA